MKTLSFFTRPQVVVNLYAFLSSTENKGRYFDETHTGLQQLESK